jgi:hypothetical protein
MVPPQPRDDGRVLRGQGQERRTAGDDHQVGRALEASRQGAQSSQHQAVSGAREGRDWTKQGHGVGFAAEHVVGVAQDFPGPATLSIPARGETRNHTCLVFDRMEPSLTRVAENAMRLSFEPRRFGAISHPRRLSTMTTIGINGFGRIGRMAFRAALARKDTQVVAVNDLLDPRQLAHLLKYDSVRGRFGHEVVAKDGILMVDGRPMQVGAEKDPALCAWGDVDVVIESTGAFLTREKSSGHLRAGAKRVILSAPPKDDTPMYVVGVNSARYAGEAIISAASCTTNCLAPVAKVLDENFGIRRGLMTTVHATTSSQKNRRWRVQERLALRSRHSGEHHPGFHWRGQGGHQGVAQPGRKADGHGLPRAGIGRVRGGPDLRACARD